MLVCYNHLCLKHGTDAAVAELADAYDSKSYGKPYGFESHQRHLRSDFQQEQPSKQRAFFALKKLYKRKRGV